MEYKSRSLLGNKYCLLIVVSIIVFVVFLCVSSFEDKEIGSIDKNYPLEVIDNEIRIKTTGEVLYRFIPVDGGNMMFEYADTIIHKSQKTSVYYSYVKEIPSFLIGETPVTYRLWYYVMYGVEEIEKNNLHNFSHFYRDSISAGGWNQFIEKLNSLTGRTFCLPSSFQWEYAARAGVKNSNYLYSGSDDIDEVGFYKNNSMADYITRPGRYKKPNELGIYDMSGNVWELTTTNITEIFSNMKMFLKERPILYMGISRGGDWTSKANECLVKHMPRGMRLYTGARLVLKTDTIPSVPIVIDSSLPIALSHSNDKAVVSYEWGYLHMD